MHTGRGTAAHRSVQLCDLGKTASISEPVSQDKITVIPACLGR